MRVDYLLSAAIYLVLLASFSLAQDDMPATDSEKEVAIATERYYEEQAAAAAAAAAVAGLDGLVQLTAINCALGAPINDQNPPGIRCHEDLTNTNPLYRVFVCQYSSTVSRIVFCERVTMAVCFAESGSKQLMHE